MAGLFGGMPYGMFGAQGLMSGAMPQEIGWAQKIGALLQDAGASYDGRQGYAVPMLAFQQNRLGDQKKYQDTLDQLSAPPSTSLTPPQFSFPGGSPAPGTLQIDNPGAINAAPGGPLSGGQFDQMLPLLRGMDPDRGLPLAFNAVQQQQAAANAPPEYRDVGGSLYQLPRTLDGRPTKVVDGLVKAPTTRTIRQGSMDITQEFQPDGSWKEVARGNAWQPNGGGGEQNKPPVGYRWGANGTLEAIPGGPADSTGKNSKATDTQRVTALYADRAREAENVLSGTGQPGSKNYKPGVQSQGASFWQNARSRIPGVGNYAVSDDFQKYDQAKRNFVNAILRKESGAVISNEEFANAERQYFPQPGDSTQVLAQKRANRETAIEGLRRAAGTALNEPGGRQPQNSASVDGAAQETKSLGGKTYVKINGQWYEQ